MKHETRDLALLLFLFLSTVIVMVGCAAEVSEPATGDTLAFDTSSPESLEADLEQLGGKADLPRLLYSSAYQNTILVGESTRWTVRRSS